MSSDYKKKYTDLVKYIPSRYRSVAGTSLLQNLHNKFLTKEESAKMLGYVGDKVRFDESPYVPAVNIDREINSLVPAVYTKIGTEEHIFTFSDVLKKLELLGVDTNEFGTWGKATGFNFVPPINLDKFSNYTRYRWYGHLMASIDGLGFENPSYNSTMAPEYYVIEKIGGQSDWAKNNFWVHEADANQFFADQGYSFTIDATLQAIRPIIEYDVKLEQSMTLHIANGRPSDAGTEVNQLAPSYKTEFNQKPLFNLYLYNGQHSGFVSPIFYYAEGNDYAVDFSLKARIKKDAYGDFTFEQGLLSKDGQRTLFFKLDGDLKSIWKKGPVEYPKYYTKDGAGVLIESDPKDDLDGAGAWKYPSQMFHNITHENRKQVGYGDLLGHFTDIIASQVEFEGNPYGVNNFRNLASQDLGLGGRIKDYDNNFGLFLGLTNQLDSSIPSIIEFGKLQYAQLIGSVREYVSRNIADFIVDGKIVKPRATISNVPDASVEPMFKELLTFIASRNDASVFSDTTSGIVGFPATIPYLGLAAPTKPVISFDSRVGGLVLTHHDAHLTFVEVLETEIEKNIANMTFPRSTGQSTPGVVGFVSPSRPFANQFWFDTNTNTLKYFAVKSDVSAVYPAVEGDMYYDRAANKLYKFVGTDFVAQPNPNAAWTRLNVSAVIAQLTLMIENQLYTDCPFDSVKIDTAAQLAASPDQAKALLEKELAIYAAKHSLDLYGGDYAPSDAFTWNYSNAPINGQSNARWFTINQAYFGCIRPNLEPWKLQGFATRPAFWNGMYADTTGSRLWNTQMWSDIKTGSNGHPAWTGKLGVDVMTDGLLPPYVSPSDPRSSEALLTQIPSGIADNYAFGEMGPTEFQWTTSLDYAYDVLKTCFRIDPIVFTNTTWGYNKATVDSYTIDRHEHRAISHTDYLLHGEAPTPKFNGHSFEQLICYAEDTVWTLTCVGHTQQEGSIFSIKGNVAGIITREYLVNTDYVSAYIRFTLHDNGADFNIGDKFIITAATNTAQFIPSSYSKFNGLNQWFVNLNRYNSVDMSISLADNILRDWELKLGYRMSGLVNTELLNIKTDQFPLHDTNYSVIIKENKGLESHWLNAIRVQLIRVGTTVMKDGRNVPYNKGADWVFRIETFNTYNPTIEYYEYDKTGAYKTYFANERANTQDEWKHLTNRTELVSRVTPFTVTGIENVANIIFGYVDRLDEQGWRFNKGNDPIVDERTGRVVNWQLFIERFIDQQYLGTGAGSGVILNPFANNVWFATEHGFVSNMRKVSMTDATSTQTIFDSFGNAVHGKDIQIFRNDDITEIQSSVVMGGVHLLVDEYEHIVLFNNYVFDKSRAKLIYDPFLGVRVNRIYVSAERQVEFNGRLSFGGHYIKDHKVERNIEASITDMLNYYDADKMIDNSQTAKHARGLLGYEPKQYMADIELTDKSQFGFWRGLVSNKGSNLSVKAFLNSARFESAKIDEFWAYKLAEFGDARQLAFPEIKMSSSDSAHNYTKINFTGLLQPEQVGFINISSTDESRWVATEDVQQEVSFVAEKLAEIVFEDGKFGVIYDLVQNEKPIIADVVQVFLEVILESDKSQINPTRFLKRTENYELLNSSTIRFIDDLRIEELLGEEYKWLGKIVVRCFGPSQPKFNPAKLIDYKNKVVVSELSLWDPARGSHTTEALEIVDMISPTDPAKFNYSVRTTNNVNYDQYRPWDNKDVGRVWWNTKNLGYVPYSDKNIFPSLDVRLSYWGALADWSTIELYEWTESTVHPSKYATLVAAQETDSSLPAEKRASGEVAMTDLYTRTRTWQQRPVAWGYTDVPGSVVPFLSSIGEYRVTFKTDLQGGTMAILSSSDWMTSFPEFSIGMKISGGIFHYNVDDVSDPENFKLSKPYGEAVVTGLNQEIIIGSSLSLDNPVIVPLQYTF